MEEGQERDCSPNEEQYIIDDDHRMTSRTHDHRMTWRTHESDDMEDGSPDLWMTERNEDDTKLVRSSVDDPSTKKHHIHI